MKCIFTDDELTDGTAPEHVLQNAFGGRKTTKRAICSKCNNTFGGGIDKALVKQFDVVRNLMQMRSGTGNLAPTLRNLQAGIQTINARGDGTLESVSKPFTAARLADGSFRVQIMVNSLQQLDKLIPNIAAKIGISDAELRKQLIQARATKIEQRPGTIPFHLEFGGGEALRSVTKSLLVLWALAVGNHEVRGACYESARGFATTGSRDFQAARAGLDTRLLDHDAILQQGYGPLYNLMWVQSDDVGRVTGHFTFYNVVAMRILLAESGGAPNRATGLISNPLNPRVWSDKIANHRSIRPEWLNAPAVDLDATKQRIGRLYQTYLEAATPKEWERIVQDVFDTRGLGPDDPTPPRDIDQIVARICDRLGRQILALPFEEIIDPNAVAAALGSRNTAEE